MKISSYQSVKTQQPAVLTWEFFLQLTESQQVKSIATQVRNAIEQNDNARKDQLKKLLPVVTWQAWFEGARKNSEAHPNGLFMLDIDHMTEIPEQVYATKIAGRIEELGIVLVHKTISCSGLRIIAFCRPEFETIAENQRWLSNELMLEHDEACKDFARSSFLVPFEYMFHIKGEIFNPEYEAGKILQIKQPHYNNAAPQPQQPVATASTGQTLFKGLPLIEIACQWLKQKHGGYPSEGERNTVLYDLAIRMKYICDFNPYVIAANIPHCGLADEEVFSLCKSACGGQRLRSMPRDLQQTIDLLTKTGTAEQDNEPIETDEAQTLPAKLPVVFQQFADVAPQDYKEAVVLCLLPLLGTLGSKLRAQYLNDKIESPSFMVALEAPQASGKSFIEDLTKYCLVQIDNKDTIERDKEREFEQQLKTIKAAGSGTKQEREDIKQLMQNRPIPIIRHLPATTSITKLLIRMENAQGLHLFALAVEIDTVYKAFKRGFSNLSDLLRCSFDNSEFGQEYASETSYSGTVRMYFNTLYSGTPAAMRRFYNNSEDGTMSRTMFVTLPDQFGKKMPRWDKFDDRQRAVVNSKLTELYEVSIKGDEVMPPTRLNLKYLNETMESWCEKQRQVSVSQNDRTRNTFYRRCAEVAFRAGMIAHYMERGTSDKRSDVVAEFATWVADKMLEQFVTRVNLNNEEYAIGNVFARQIYLELEDTFTRSQLQAKLTEHGFKTHVRQVLSKWKTAGLIIMKERYGAQIIEKNESSKIQSK